MYAIFKREFLSYFRNPVGYIAIALFSFLSGFIFVSSFSNAAINISAEINSLRSFFVVIIPIITMGLLADDRKRGTEVLYYTTPIDLFSVVAGKFFAALSLYAIMFINVFIHMIVTKANGGVIGVGAWGSVVVFFFLAALFISIGIFASAITDSQIISAITSFIMILIVQLLSTIGSLLSNAVTAFLPMLGVAKETSNSIGDGLENAINWLDPFSKTNSFRYGTFGVAPLFFCISFTIVFLFLTFRILEKKRWAQ